MLYRRLVRWKPRYRSLIIAFLVVLLPVGWFSEPYGGKLGWPLTILWTWPILYSIIGIRGIARTRKLIKASRARWSGDRLTVCQDVLLVVVPTIGRHDVYPALERSILSYVAYLPRCFPHLRIDLIVEEGCEAGAWPHIQLPDSATVAQLTTAWSRWLGSHTLAVRRKAILTEVGIRAMAGAYRNPALWNGVGQATIVTLVQTNWFRALCGAVAREHIGGIYWWEVSFDASPADPVPFKSDRLTFLDRPAQQVIRNCFAKLSS